MLATRGGPGPTVADDPIDRETAAVGGGHLLSGDRLAESGQQKSTENPGDGGPPKRFVNAFGPDVIRHGKA